MLRQLIGQSRGPRHHLGDQRQKSWIGVEQREKRHACREAGEKLSEPPERHIRVRSCPEYAQQLGDEFGQDLARPLAAGGRSLP
jgi:hypothetical protein